MNDRVQLILKHCKNDRDESPEGALYGVAVILTMRPFERETIVAEELGEPIETVDAEIGEALQIIQGSRLDMSLVKSTASFILPYFPGDILSSFSIDFVTMSSLARFPEIVSFILKNLDPDFMEVYTTGHTVDDVIRFGEALNRQKYSEAPEGEASASAGFIPEGGAETKETMDLDGCIAEVERLLRECHFDKPQIETVTFRIRAFAGHLQEEKQSDWFMGLIIQVKLILTTCCVVKMYTKYSHNNNNQRFKADFMMARHEAMREIWRYFESQKNTELVSDNKIMYLAEKYSNIYNKLTDIVIGQDYAVNEFVQACFESEMHEPAANVPQAVFLFAGPPGVGKTFLSENVAKLLERPFKAFDMSAFATEKSELGLIGSETLFSNAMEGNLVGFVEDNPDAVILFDEIEKAHADVTRLFLSILDGARLENKMLACNTDFSHAIIIFTTNAGRGLYENRAKNLSGIPTDVLIGELRKEKKEGTDAPKFPPELCSRFASQHIVMFNHMDISSMVHIIDQRMNKACKELREGLNIEIEYDKRLALLLLMHYGDIDVRVISSKSGQFIRREIYELARQMMQVQGTKTIKKIRFMLDDDRISGKIKDFFSESEEARVAVICDEAPKVHLAFERVERILFFDTADELMEHGLDDIAAVIVDPLYGLETFDDRVLGMDDYDSTGLRILKELLAKNLKTPVYILETVRGVSEVDRKSFFMRGVEDVVSLYSETIAQEIEEIVNKHSLEKKCRRMLQRRKIFDFETLQETPDVMGNVCIKFYDITLKDAVNAEDEDLIIDIDDRPNVKFGDVIGAENAKNELRDFIKYLDDPRKYMRNALDVPKGILLYGPPGTGKTLLAKAMAGECEATFISVSAAELRMGGGEYNVKRLFETARKYAPAIIFLDEVDAIARYRTGGITTTGAEEAMLNMLLTQMDGFKDFADTPVFVIAATNFEVDAADGHPGRQLDPAFLRRFGSRILVDLPNEQERKQFIEFKLDPSKHKLPGHQVTEAGIESLAKRTPFMSPAELENILAQAFRNAARKETNLDDTILDETLEEYLYGEARVKDDNRLYRTAVHEASHAYMYVKNGGRPVYMTIISRADFGGYMQRDAADVAGNRSREKLLGDIRTSLAGRVGEMVFFGGEDSINTGASSDLRKASTIALRMLTAYGMEDGHLFSMPYDQLVESNLMPLYARKADQLLAAQEQECRRLIEEGKDKIKALAQRLFEKTHLTQEEIMEIIG